MQLPPFIEELKARMEERGIPFIALPIAIILVVLVGAFVLFSQPPSTTSFSLTVLSGGQPVSGAVVEVYDASGKFLDSGVSNANGIVSFKSLPAALLRFKVSKSGVGEAERRLDLSKATAGRITLGEETPATTATPKPPLSQSKARTTKFTQSTEAAQKARLAVLVRDEDRKPVEANVTLFDSESGAEIEARETTRGTALFEDLEVGGKVFVTVSAEGYLPFPASGERQDIVISKKAVAFTAILSKATGNNSASGTILVVDGENQSVGRARVWVLSTDNAIARSGETGSDGSFKTTLASNAFYYAVAKKDGFLPGRASFHSSSFPRIIVLRANESNSASLEVTIVDEGDQPVSGANVSIKTVSGEFLLPPKQNDFSGKAVFDELALKSEARVVATKGSKVGSIQVALNNSIVRTTVVLVLHQGFVQARAVDYFTNQTIASARFTAFYNGENISSCTGSLCQLQVRANVPITIQAEGNGYFAANTTATVLTDNTTTATVYLVPTSTQDNSLAVVQAVFDAANPSDRAEGIGVRDYRLKKGHDYVLAISFVSHNIGINDDAGLLLRASQGAYFKYFQPPAGFRGSESSSCEDFEQAFREDAAYQWVDLRSKGVVSRTYSVGFRLDPLAEDNVSIGYSTYVVKNNQWLRNPFDPQLGVSESIQSRGWCEAIAKETFSFHAGNPDVSCSDIGCLKTVFVQGYNQCGFDETGVSCENFQVSQDAASDGNLLIHYTLTPFQPPSIGNELRVGFNPLLFRLVSTTAPARPSGIRTGTTPVVFLDDAVTRGDFPFTGIVEGTIELEPLSPAPSTFLNFSFTNSHGSIVHSALISIGVPQGPQLTTLEGAACDPEVSPLTCRTTTRAFLENGTINYVKLTVNLSQHGNFVGHGYPAVRDEAAVDCTPSSNGLLVSFALNDSRASPGGVLRMSYNTNEAQLLQPASAGDYSMTVTPSEAGGASGSICARVKKTSGDVRLNFDYSSGAVTRSEIFAVELPVLPSSYTIKYDSAQQSFRLLGSNGQDAPNIALNSYPVFPADAVYLNLDYSDSPVDCTTLFETPANPCFEISTSGLGTQPYLTGLRKQVVLLKYNALNPGCNDFNNPNILRSSGVDLVFGGYCGVNIPKQSIHASVTPDNTIPAIVLSKAEDAGYSNSNCGGGSQYGGGASKAWVFTYNRQLSGSVAFPVLYTRQGTQIPASLSFTEPGVKAFAGEEGSFTLSAGNTNLAGSAPMAQATAFTIPNIVFRRRSSADWAFPFSAFSSAHRAKVNWVGTSSSAFSKTGCGLTNSFSTSNGLYAYSFESTRETSETPLIGVTTGASISLASNAYYLDPAFNGDCSTRELCGSSYTTCGKCVLPNYGKTEYADCLNSSTYYYEDYYQYSADCTARQWRPEVKSLHAPTCNFVQQVSSSNTKVLDGTGTCTQKEDPGVGKRGEKTNVAGYWLYNPLTGNEISVNVCPGDKWCNDCINQNAANGYGYTNDDGLYTFEGLTIEQQLLHCYKDTGSGDYWHHIIFDQCLFQGSRCLNALKENDCEWFLNHYDPDRCCRSQADCPSDRVCSGGSCIDATPPTYSGLAQNKTTGINAGDLIKFSATWTDNKALLSYKFSWNETGSFVNDTAVAFSGKTNTSVAIKAITAADKGKVIGWRFYASDAAGSWSDTANFIVGLSSFKVNP